MPRRARCPYCDRLFRVDKLDEHVVRCRQRHLERNQPQQQQQWQRPVGGEIVVDGTNIAHYLTATGTPRVHNLVIAQRSLISAGYTPITVVSAALIHRIDHPDILEEMIASGEVVESGRGQNDDLVMIRLAQRKGIEIVTNDRFLDWLDRYPWLAGRLRRYRMTPHALILL